MITRKILEPQETIEERKHLMPTYIFQFFRSININIFIQRQLLMESKNSLQSSVVESLCWFEHRVWGFCLRVQVSYSDLFSGFEPLDLVMPTGKTLCANPIICGKQSHAESNGFGLWFVVLGFLCFVFNLVLFFQFSINSR